MGTRTTSYLQRIPIYISTTMGSRSSKKETAMKEKSQLTDDYSSEASSWRVSTSSLDNFLWKNDENELNIKCQWIEGIMDSKDLSPDQCIWELYQQACKRRRREPSI